MTKSALLVLGDGTQFHGRVIGVTGSAAGEVVFNTSTTGYQEILTDPSRSRQIVILTYPHIGNVSTNDADEESSQIHVQGLVIRGLPLIVSSFRNTEDPSSYPKRYSIVATADTDTRKPTCLLREEGTQSGRITAGNSPDAALVLERARAFPGLNGMNLAKEVTTAEFYSWTQENWTLTGGLPEAKKEDELPYHVVAYDFGAKRNTLHMLVDRGCRLTIVPVQTSVEDVLKMNSDGIFLSNGPDDPTPCDYVITAIWKFLETDIPVFGICLGHQLPALAGSVKIVKMKSGHRDGNHPIKGVEKNVVMITAQNHGFAANEATLPINLRVTCKSLFDGMLQGIHRTDEPALNFRGHPEASPGPHDATSLLDHPIALIEQYRKTVK